MRDIPGKIIMHKKFSKQLMSSSAMLVYGTAFASLLGVCTPASAGNAGIRTNSNYVEIYSGETQSQNLGVYFNQISAYALQNNTRYYHNCYTFQSDPNSNYCYIYTVMDHESTPHISQISSLNDCTAGDQSCWDNINYFQTQDCLHPESQSRYVCAVYNDPGYRDCDGFSVTLFTDVQGPTKAVTVPASYGHIARKACLSSGADIAGLADDQVIDDGVLDITAIPQVITFGNLSGTGNLLINTHDLTIAGTSLDPFEFSGVISGDGTLTIDAGTQILSGTNDYTGRTTVNHGAVLQLGSGGASGSVMGPVLDDGTLIFDRSDSFTVSSQITGTGAIQVSGAGQLQLSGSMGAAGTPVGVITNGATLHVLSGGTIWASGITNSAGAHLTVDQGASVYDALNNSGVVSNSGIYTADVNNTGAAAIITNTTTGVWNGNILTNSGGAIINTLGTWNGTTNNGATGTLNAQGTLNGAVTNAGQVTLTGALSNNGAAFSNAAGGVLTVGANTYAGLGAVTNAGRITVGTSLAGGSLAAASMSNAGTLSLQNGRTGDTVTLTGAYAGIAGSTITVDANLSSNGNLADRVIVAGTSGTSAISIQNSGTGKIFFANPIVLVSATSGTGTFTAASDAQTTAALASNGIVNYRLGQIGSSNNWGVIASVNTTDGSSIAADTSAVLSTLNSSFYLNTHERIGEGPGTSHDKWSTQAWGRAEHGNNSFDLNTTNSDPNSPSGVSRVDMSFDGAQLGASLRMSGDSLKVHVGIMGGWTQSTVSSRGNVRSDVRIPYYGFYGLASAPGIVLDFQAHHDDLTIRPDALLTTALIKGTADTVSVSLALPYTRGVYTVEPYGSYSYSRVAIDPVALSGGVGSLEFSSLSNTVARAGVRITAETTHGDTTLLPFLSVGAAQAFGDKSVTTFRPLGGAGDVVMATDRVGAFAQVSTGLTAQWKNGTEAYVQAGARLGKSIKGVSVSTGVRFRF